MNILFRSSYGYNTESN